MAPDQGRFLGRTQLKRHPRRHHLHSHWLVMESEQGEDRQGHMALSGRKHQCKCSLGPLQPGGALQGGRIQKLENLGLGLMFSSINFPNIILESWWDIFIIFWNTLPWPLPEISQLVPSPAAVSLLTSALKEAGVR